MDTRTATFHARLAQIQRTATDLRVALFRALPRQVRIAHVVQTVSDTRLSRILFGANTSLITGITDVIYAMLTDGEYRGGKTKGQGIPDVPSKSEVRNDAARMYNKVYHYVPAQEVDDIMSLWVAQILEDAATKPTFLAKATTYKTAFSFLYDDLRFFVQDWKRKQSRGDRTDKPGVEEDQLGNLSDPRVLKNVQMKVLPRTWARIKRDIERIPVPDVDVYIELLMDGYNRKNILEDRMLPNFEQWFEGQGRSTKLTAKTMFWAKNVDRPIKKIFHKYLSSDT